ncbi:MAG: methyltransferase domain-containing protein [Deltaproteobacteria bacterium]|nr:methyltransferase domain-containing protein [Deltaproteobacteria bacterium]
MATNDDQITAWNGPQGAVWVAMQERLDNQLLPLGRATADALLLAPGQRVLDIGCGAGQTTLDLGARVGAEGRATGVDISEPLLAAARSRAAIAGAANVDFVHGDAQVQAFAADHDAIFSRFGVMFFADPVAAFANLARALRPGGRLAFVCWRRPEENPLMTAPLAAAVAAGLPPPEAGPPDTPGPFAFADRDRVVGILTAAGFTDVVATPHDEPIGGNDLDASLDLAFHVGPLARLVRDKPDQRAAVTDAVRATLARHVVAGGVVLMPSATWIVTARR